MRFQLSTQSKTIDAEDANEALDKLRTLITYGPTSVEDWMEKSKKTHPHIPTDSPEAFLEGLIEQGYVVVRG